jgi:two-component system, OmpR family, KDP operon response regulator KdpE
VTRILVVDDEASIRRALSLNLGTRGYDVLTAATGEAALQLTASEHPDLVLLDLGLPGIDGIGTIEALRGWTDVPVIVLTVRDDEASKIAALDAGADDYVTKPFAMGELLARLRAALRRAPDGAPASPDVVAESFRLDLQSHRAFVGDDRHEVHLTPTEWAIVTYLGRNMGRLVTHRQLVVAVWGPTYDPDPNLVRVHLAHIRRKLEAEPSRPRHFVTETGVGYRFEP